MTHATKAIYRWLLSDYIKVRMGNNIHDNKITMNVLYIGEQHIH